MEGRYLALLHEGHSGVALDLHHLRHLVGDRVRARIRVGDRVRVRARVRVSP